MEITTQRNVVETTKLCQVFHEQAKNERWVQDGVMGRLIGGNEARAGLQEGD